LTDKSGKAPSPEELRIAQEEAQRALAHAGGMAHLRRHVIESTSTLAGESLDPSLFPKVTIPKLDGLLVSVPEPAPITEEEVHEAFDRLAFEAAPRTPRLRGEAVQMGDEVRLDLISYMAGHLLPMSAHEGLRLMLEPDIFMPGFGTGLVGTPVGEAAILQLKVPADFPIEEARGEDIVLAVEICEASQIHPMDPGDPQLFETIGLGADLTSTLEVVMLLLLNERTRALSQSIMTHMMKTITDKVDVAIPDELIEAELKSWWAQSEGRFLQAKGIEQEDIETSWEGWLADEELHEDAIQRIKSGLVLYAIAQREDLVSDMAALKGFIGDAAKAIGLSLSPQDIDLSRPFKKREQLVDQFVYAQAIAYLSRVVTIQIGDNPPIQPDAEVSISSQIPS
jgi:trigger factor